MVRQIQLGLAGRLIGIDLRPRDNLLYGIQVSAQVLAIDSRTGAARRTVRLQQTLLAGVRASVAFNPAAGRLRLIGSDGTNVRANIVAGTVTKDLPLNFVQPNPFGGVTPRVVAAAYRNNINGAKRTLLFDIDQATQALCVQVSPNNGTLNRLGLLGIDVGTLGLDIEASASGVNPGWVVTDNRLFQIDRAGGAVWPGGCSAGLDASVRAVAVLP